MEALISKDDVSEYENIISKYNTDDQQKRIENSVKDFLEHIYNYK